MRTKLVTMALSAGLLAFNSARGADQLDSKPIQIEIDATDIARRIVHIHEEIPAFKKGMTLNYPKWLPGVHSPAGDISRVAGLQVFLNGKKASWQRDRTEIHTFEVQADRNWSQEKLTLDFDYLSPTSEKVGPIEMSSEILMLEWISLVLYPSGAPLREIPIEASVLLPKDWKFGSALEVKKESQDSKGLRVQFKGVSLEEFLDSPLFAGVHTKRIQLSEPSSPPVFLNLFADRPELLEAKPEQIKVHQSLVQQAVKLFDSRHFDHYDFLFMLSDQVRHIGLEHHQSSENGAEPGYFTEWDKTYAVRHLLPHEFAHSWNGKFKRPADSLTPNYQMPTQNSLLWVYEGQTEYWGSVLAARSGLWSFSQTMDFLATFAAFYDHHAGRAWRPVQDTTLQPIMSHRSPQPWVSWQRAEDYYREGHLIWLEVDTLIRERSSEKRSLDDFAKAFFGGTGHTPVAYEFADVVAALNRVEPYDWSSFLRERLDGVGRPTPLEGIKKGGYQLVYTAEPNQAEKDSDKLGKQTSFFYSLGIAVLEKEHKIRGVLWNSPAFQAKLIEGTTMIAVNGKAYSSELLTNAIKAAAIHKKPIELLVRSGEDFRTVSVPYYGGLRYPHLERVKGVPARLDEIFKAK